MSDGYKDYDELLKMFEDEPTDSKRPGSRPASTGSKSSGTAQKGKVDKFSVSSGADESSAPSKPSYKGGVYFSNPPRNIRREAQRQKRAGAGPRRKSAPPPTTQKQNKAIEARRERARKKGKPVDGSNLSFVDKILSSERLSHFALCLAIVILSSVVLCIYGVGCINDVLAIKTEDVSVEVKVSKGETDSDVIERLADEGLIKRELFCKLFCKFFSSDGEYVTGVYTLTPSMGVEKMLSTMKADITLSETVTLTFPEGWTIDQIAEKLEANEVCTAASFINTLQSIDFSEEYEFIKSIPEKEKRFRILEGYIYPDTYEFYIGENPSSVIRRFLDNFQNRWTSDHSKMAEEMGISMDEAIIMASILQKEAATTEQMAPIASILYNRLAKPSVFLLLQCDSTEDYLLKTIKPTLTSSTEDTERYIAYRDNYDTYSTACTGLPVGAICNPGASAIKAALDPADTNYYYFRHDKKGNIYYANSLSEHEQNGFRVAQIDGEDD